MPGKRLQFDDGPWQAIEAVARQSDRSFQELKAVRFVQTTAVPHRAAATPSAISYKGLAIPRQRAHTHESSANSHRPRWLREVCRAPA